MAGAAVAEPLTVPATDGYALAARRYDAPGERQGVVLIVPAMGVKQSFYGEFAGWLASAGLETLSFDLRGMGDSAPATLRGFECDVLTWARRDCSAMLHEAQARAAGAPVFWIGHSLGGQVLAMTPGHEALAAAVTVASGVGYWRENAYPLRRYSWWLWHVIAPLATALFGYFPGRRLRIVGDLPKGVIEQWSRWCRHPDYAVGVEGEEMRDAYRRVRVPIYSVSFTDDEYMSASNIAVLHGFYENAPREMRRMAPADLGLPRVGHFGFFRPEAGARLWPQVLTWMRKAS